MPTPDPTSTAVDTTGREESAPRSEFFGLSRGDQIFVALLLVVLMVLSACYWAKISGWGRHPIEIQRLPAREYDFRIDVNRASWVQWAQLEGIGEVLARRIVEDRNVNGPFQSVDEVQRVNGVGEKKLAAIREWLYVGEIEVRETESNR